MRTQTFHAACLCGTVRYAVDTIPRLASPCICPRCRGQGVRIVAADAGSFVLLAGEDALTERVDGARQPHHFFCRRCGEAVFGVAAQAGQEPRVMVNAACLGRGAVDGLAIPGRKISKPSKWEV